MKKENSDVKKVSKGRKFGKVLLKVLIVICAIALFGLITNAVLSKLYPKLTFIGHASIKIKATTGEVIYVDPYFPTKSYNEPADIILVTHGHSDHNQVKLCKQKENCKVIKWSDAIKDGEYQVFEEGNVRIEAVPSGGNSNHSLQGNVGYIITVDGVSVYHSGDTSFVEETKCIADKDIDYALYTVNGVYTMGPDEATEMADFIGAKVNIPIHGNGKQYWEQRKQFHAKHTKRLVWGQSIFLTKK